MDNINYGKCLQGLYTYWITINKYHEVIHAANQLGAPLSYGYIRLITLW